MKKSMYIILGIVCAIVLLATYLYAKNFVDNSPSIAGGGYDKKLRNKYSGSEETASQKATSSQLVAITEELYFNKEMQSTLLTSKETSVQADDMLATLFPSRFLKQDSKIWQITRHPGLLDRPSASVGMHDNKLFFLSTLDSVASFYNVSRVFPVSVDEATTLATELLQIVYFRDEFGYAHNTTTGRGYVIIKSSKDIVEQTKDPILKTLSIVPPNTTVKENLFLTSIWFWGKHNCELHKFTMTSSADSGITVYNDELVGNFGTCRPLHYE